jgi:hypothetical protein
MKFRLWAEIFRRFAQIFREFSKLMPQKALLHLARVLVSSEWPPGNPERASPALSP